VVTGYKGPIVYGFRELRDLAAAHGVRFVFEAAVMGGAPIFSLCREALPAARLIRFRGILKRRMGRRPISSPSPANTTPKQCYKAILNLEVATLPRAIV